MRIKGWREGTLDFRTTLWVCFWLFILTTGEPDLIDAVTAWIGRH